jgi:hypothetical protein
MNPRLPKGRKVIVVTEFMINSSCLWFNEKQNGGKKWKQLEQKNRLYMDRTATGLSASVYAGAQPSSPVLRARKTMPEDGIRHTRKFLGFL